MENNTNTTIVNNLESVITNIKGCQFATIAYVSEVKMNKRGNPLANTEVLKFTRLNCQLNYSYENAVNNRIEKAGGETEFIADSLPWGIWKVVNKIITHKGKDYLRFYTHQNAKPETRYFIDGKEVTDTGTIAIIKQFTPAKSFSQKQADNGVIENQVCPKAIPIDNILELITDGNKYVTEKQEFAYAM